MDPLETGGIAALAGLIVIGAFKLIEKALVKKNGFVCKADMLAPVLQDLRVTIGTLGVKVDGLGDKVDNLGGNVAQLAGVLNDFRREMGAGMVLLGERTEQILASLPTRRKAGK
jgi:hypothetical protein